MLLLRALYLPIQLNCVTVKTLYRLLKYSDKSKIDIILGLITDSQSE